MKRTRHRKFVTIPTLKINQFYAISFSRLLAGPDFCLCNFDMSHKESSTQKYLFFSMKNIDDYLS